MLEAIVQPQDKAFFMTVWILNVETVLRFVAALSRSGSPWMCILKAKA